MRWMQAAAALVCVALAPAPVGADDDAAKREARRLLSDGDKELKRGDAELARDPIDAREAYERALDLYKRAYEAVPNPQIYFAIANAEEKLGRYVDAHAHYRRLLEEAEDIGDRLRAAVEIRLDAVLGKLSILTVVVEPDDAIVFVDEREVGRSPLPETLVLEPGPHKVVVRKAGFQAAREQFHTEAGDRITKTIRLEPVPDVEVAVTAGPVRAQQRDQHPERTVLIASLVGMGSLMVATSVFGVLSLSKHGVYSDESKERGAREDARDSGKTLALTTDILLGATVAAAGFTAFYYYGIYKPRARAMDESSRSRTSEAAPWIAPWASASGAGVAFGSRF